MIDILGAPMYVEMFEHHPNLLGDDFPTGPLMRINSLVIALPLLSLLTACSDGAGSTQTLTVNWTVAKPDGTPDQCSDGYPKVKVVASSVSGSNTRNGDDFTALYDCTANTATIKLYTSGDEPDETLEDGSIKRYGAQSITGKYTITLVISDGTGEIEYQATPTQDVDLSGGPKTLSFTVTPSAAPTSTAWGFTTADGQDNLPSCASAGVSQIRVKVRREQLPDMSPDPTLPETVQTHPCDFEYYPDLANEDCSGCQGVAMSNPLLFGYYSMSLEALSPDGEVVGSLPYDPFDIVRIDRESLFFSRTFGGNPSRAYVSLGSRDFYKVAINNK